MRNKYIYKTLHIPSGEFLYLTHCETKQKTFDFSSKTLWKVSLINSIHIYNLKVEAETLSNTNFSHGGEISIKEFEMVRVKIN